jgi:hypothetical protein
LDRRQRRADARLVASRELVPSVARPLGQVKFEPVICIQRRFRTDEGKCSTITERCPSKIAGRLVIPTRYITTAKDQLKKNRPFELLPSGRSDPPIRVASTCKSNHGSRMAKSKLRSRDR